MKLVFLLLVCLAVICLIYCSWVLGIVLLCETMPELRKAKRCAWLIPLIEIYIFTLVLMEEKKKNRWKLFISYLASGQKSMLFTYAMAKRVQEQTAKQSKSCKNQAVRPREYFVFARDSAYDLKDRLFA